MAGSRRFRELEVDRRIVGDPPLALGPSEECFDLDDRGVAGRWFIDCIASAGEIVEGDRGRRLGERRLQNAPQATIGPTCIARAFSRALFLRRLDPFVNQIGDGEGRVVFTSDGLRLALSRFGVEIGAGRDPAGLRLGEIARPGGGDRGEPTERLADLTAVLLPRLKQEGLTTVGADAHGEAREAIVEDELVFFAARRRRERLNDAIDEMSWHERKTPRTQMRTKRNAT